MINMVKYNKAIAVDFTVVAKRLETSDNFLQFIF